MSIPVLSSVLQCSLPTLGNLLRANRRGFLHRFRLISAPCFGPLCTVEWELGGFHDSKKQISVVFCHVWSSLVISEDPVHRPPKHRSLQKFHFRWCLVVSGGIRWCLVISDTVGRDSQHPRLPPFSRTEQKLISARRALA